MREILEFIFWPLVILFFILWIYRIDKVADSATVALLKQIIRGT